MKTDTAAWTAKGATLSDVTATKEYGLTRAEIIEAIRSGDLQFRENNLYGNPFLRLIRKEVEALVQKKYGKEYLEQKLLKKELGEINRTLKTLKPQVSALEKRKAEILDRLGPPKSRPVRVS